MPIRLHLATTTLATTLATVALYEYKLPPSPISYEIGLGGGFFALGWSASCALPIESSWHRRLTAADFTSTATATLNRSRHRRRRLGIAAAAAAAATPTAENTTTIATSSAAAAVATSMAIIPPIQNTCVT